MSKWVIRAGIVILALPALCVFVLYYSFLGIKMGIDDIRDAWARPEETRFARKSKVRRS